MSQPLPTPPPPPVRRLSRSAFFAACAVGALTVAIAFFIAAPGLRKGAPGAAPVPVARLSGTHPGFLERQPGSLPPPPDAQSEAEYLRRLQLPPLRPATDPLASPPASEASAMDPSRPNLTVFPPPPVAVPPPAPVSPPDPRRLDYERALRSPLVAEPEKAAGSDASPSPALSSLGSLTESLARLTGRAATGAIGATGAAGAIGTPGAFPASLQAVQAIQPLPPSPVSAPGAGSTWTLPAAPGRALTRPLAAWRVPAGSVLPAVLLTGINSDTPGDLVAQLSADVYDSSQSVLLIPKGSRLLGTFGNQVAVGQERLVVAWTRLLFPDGTGRDLPGLPSVSTSGEAGLPARVNNHLGRVFGDAILLSLLSAGVQLSQPQAGSALTAPSAGQTAAAALGQELGSVSTEMIRRDLGLRPTLRIAPGTRFLAYLSTDLPFQAAYAAAF